MRTTPAVLPFSLVAGLGLHARPLPEVGDERGSAPAPIARPMPGLPHPQISACWKPNTLSVTPAAISTRPR